MLKNNGNCITNGLNPIHSALLRHERNIYQCGKIPQGIEVERRRRKKSNCDETKNEYRLSRTKFLNGYSDTEAAQHIEELALHM